MQNKEAPTWNRLPWRKLEQHCFRIQKRIYRASQQGKQRAVHKLQKFLMKSEAARLLAVRRVTQDNEGGETAGVDGVKSVTAKGRLAIAANIHPKHWKDQPAKPVRRVWIPKPGKAEKRPIGILTIFDRCKQALVKLALEPEWEAKFEANSYGFRPGRGTHDAIGAVFLAIKRTPKFVFDADIKAAFDHVNQAVLLDKLQTYPALRQTIEAWLKAGVMDGKTYVPTETGLAQGGVISPLLMNVVLHGMEMAAKEGCDEGGVVEKPLMIRYADDFVIFHSDLEELQKAVTRVTNWLQQVGLSLNTEKTRITHSLTPYQGQVGFDFLGFTIRQFPVEETQMGEGKQGNPPRFRTIIEPDEEASTRHMTAIVQQVYWRRSASQARVIKELNPIIARWTAYYKTVVSAEAFSDCDGMLRHELMDWAKRRHPDKAGQWIIDRYWHHVEKRGWVFATAGGVELRMHSETNVQRHIKVRGTASPYDGNLVYWSRRLKAHPLLHETEAQLLHKQAGTCCWCGLHFKEEDTLEVETIDPDGAKTDLSNKLLLHRHCRDQCHAELHERARSQEEAVDRLKEEMSGDEPNVDDSRNEGYNIGRPQEEILGDEHAYEL